MEKLGFDPYTVTRTKTWADPLRWQAQAQAAGIQERVFTCSWSDWFHPDADAWRAEAWDIVRRCPNLIFQILTKRPELIPPRVPLEWTKYDRSVGFSLAYPNVWLGVSVENPNFLYRMELLRQIPATVRFISAEPLLAPLGTLNLEGFHWVIVGGESGPGFRPMDHAWAREIRDQCQREQVAFFFKQSAAIRTEMGTQLDGREWKEYPLLTSPESPVSDLRSPMDSIGVHRSDPNPESREVPEVR
jgi:protein gp37